MRMKKKYIFSFIIITSILLTLSFNGSFAKTDPLTLNQENFEKNIKDYIDIIDDYLIPNTSFEISDILSENYDALVNFSLDYINDNKENYEIIIENNKEYINVDEIYKITNKFFGQKYFVILNEEVENNLIELKKNLNEIKMIIKDIEINNYTVCVTYENIDLKYIYEFKNNDDNLILYNVRCENI